MPRSRSVAAFCLLSLVLACAPRPSSPTPAWPASPPATLLSVAPTPDDDARVLPLQGAHNGRDLGGLAGTHAPIPANRFFRTASLAHATESDKELLLERGVKLDVDLRTVWEAIRSPDPLAHDPRFHYVRVSLLGIGLYDVLYPTASRAALYVHALEHHQAAFRDVFRALAAEQQGAVLVHCASGKDRTGMVAAILLSLAGVSREAIVHDYAVSAQYLHLGPERIDLATSLRDSPPGAIDAFLRVLTQRYGGAYAYLRTIGVSDADASALVTRLGQ